MLRAIRNMETGIEKRVWTPAGLLFPRLDYLLLSRVHGLFFLRSIH
jgi:hypothetical protein